MSEFAELWKELANIKQTMARTFVEGTVEEVDPKAQTARLKIGEDSDGKPILGPSVAYSQYAGAFKGHIPVSKGQQMTMIAPGGDWRRATLWPMTFSDENKSPSEKGDENVITYGDFKVVIKKDDITVTVGDKVHFSLNKDSGAKLKIDGTEHTWTKDGIKAKTGEVEHEITKSKVEQKVGSAKHEWTGAAFTETIGGTASKLSGSGVDVTGGKLTHDGRNIGSGHVHAGVQPGLGRSQQPDP